MKRFLIVFLLLVPFYIFSQIQLGSNLEGDAPYDYSGRSVSLSGDGNTLAIGAPENDSNGSQAGHVRAYNWDGTNWIQKGGDMNGQFTNAWSGSEVSLSENGNTLAVSSPFHEGVNGATSGQVRIFIGNGSAWIQRGLGIDGEALGDESGHSLSLSTDGNTLPSERYSMTTRDLMRGIPVFFSGMVVSGLKKAWILMEKQRRTTVARRLA